MRAWLYRLLIALPAAALLYFGWYWAAREGGGCSPAHEDQLAALGTAIIVVSVVALAAAAVKRWIVGSLGVGVGLVLTVIGFGIGIGCLQ